MKKSRDNEEQETMMLANTEEGEILARLGERVEKAVLTIQELRRERDMLRARVDDLQAQVDDHKETSTRLTTLEEDYDRYRKERGEIRDRIETILSSLESLDPTAETTPSE